MTDHGVKFHQVPIPTWIGEIRAALPGLGFIQTDPGVWSRPHRWQKDITLLVTLSGNRAVLSEHETGIGHLPGIVLCGLVGLRAAVLYG